MVRSMLFALLVTLAFGSESIVQAQEQAASQAPPSVLTGIDVLQRDDFRQLAGRNVGLITNHTGLNQAGVSTVELLHAAQPVNLVALFSPEHGFAGKLDTAKIGDAQDQGTGLKIHSLYGETRAPTAESLQGIDTLVFDIQDIGTRFYTYISTMGNAMKAAAEHDIRFVVLDRPNPIGGVEVQGPVLDIGSESFVGFHPLPVRHGMTAGELARMFNAELKFDLDLEVITVEGWRRGEFFDATGLVWTNPSPNMRSLTQAHLYPGIGLLETTNISVGRGTDTPFEVIGAPWIEPRVLAHELNSAALPGVRFVPIRFTPNDSKFKDQPCGGINFVVTNRETFDPLATGFTVAVTLRRLYPTDWDTASLNRLLAHAETRDAILDGKSVAEILKGYEAGLQSFKSRRAAYLIYD
ncbi:MAG TPA: DUF1343 domain-containing protein [Pirellulaceae bacterium]|nr:DUF1343 domain-containing protein [Pirellulaceae bacterium]